MADLIDRQEALEGLYDVFFDNELSAAYPKEADKVLDVIRKLPSANYQQVTGKLDCISRQQALALRFTKAINEDGVIYVPLGEYLSGIESLPSAQPESPEWVRKVGRMHSKALKMPYIKKPMAWALYQVWKEYDNE